MQSINKKKSVIQSKNNTKRLQKYNQKKQKGEKKTIKN